MLKKKGFKIFLLVAISALAVMAVSMTCFATEASPVPLVQTSEMQLVDDFGADLKATVPVILACIIPVSLAIWGIGFAIKTGLSWLMGAASRAI